MPTIYRSKVDIWLFVVLAFAALAALYSAAQTMAAGTTGSILVAVLVAVVGVGLPLWLLFSTRYTLEATYLLAQSGPFKLSLIHI